MCLFLFRFILAPFTACRFLEEHHHHHQQLKYPVMSVERGVSSWLVFSFYKISFFKFNFITRLFLRFQLPPPHPHLIPFLLLRLSRTNHRRIVGSKGPSPQNAYTVVYSPRVIANTRCVVKKQKENRGLFTRVLSSSKRDVFAVPFWMETIGGSFRNLWTKRTGLYPLYSWAFA